jgi:alkylated DNA repair dioxygenase AlkB
VEQDYKVMGHVLATAGEFVSSEKMQNDIKKKAMEKGADAVIIEGLNRYQTGESTSYHEETKEKDGKVVTTASSNTSTEEKKEIKAVFIKYR